VLRVQQDGQWFELAYGPRVHLEQRRALRAILCELAERAGAQSAAQEQQLIGRGWADEHISPEAARNRLRSALSTLRKLGLGKSVERVQGGYRLSPDIEVRWVP
jgi:DNA-binding IscR family transcriptional regulator